MILSIFSEIKDKKDLVKAFAMIGNAKAALEISKMDDIQFKRAVKQYNKLLDRRRQELSRLHDDVCESLGEHSDSLGVALSVLKLSNQYVKALKGAKASGMLPEDSTVTVAEKLEEALVLEYLGRHINGNSNEN